MLKICVLKIHKIRELRIRFENLAIITQALIDTSIMVKKF